MSQKRLGRLLHRRKPRSNLRQNLVSEAPANDLAGVFLCSTRSQKPLPLLQALHVRVLVIAQAAILWRQTHDRI